MSKLLALKEWLTIKDAATYLTDVLAEPVNDADIYRLALDGHLVISMNFVYPVKAKTGAIVGKEKVKYCTTTYTQYAFRKKKMAAQLRWYNSKFPKDYRLNIIEIPEYIEVKVFESLNLDNKRFVNLSKGYATVDGVWDLLMVGAERLYIESLFYEKTSGIEIDGINLDGAFFEKNGIACWLMECLIPFDGSEEQLKKIKETIKENKLSDEEANKLYERHRKHRQSFFDNLENYYLPGGVPNEGVILVVRKENLDKFIAKVTDATKVSDKAVTTRERRSFLLLIAALMKEAKINRQTRGMATAIQAMTENLGHPLSDDTIRNILNQMDDILDN